MFRNLYKYKRRGYVIENCNLCHQPHYRTRTNDVVASCDQVLPGDELWAQFVKMFEFTEPNHFQNNHIAWEYANFTETWGFPGQYFSESEH